MFGRKKVEVPIWPLQAEYDRAKDALAKLWPGTAEHSKLLDEVLKMEEKRAAHEMAYKPVERQKISGNGWLAFTATLLGSAAPYAIEKAGHLANHMKGRVTYPNVWKDVK